jgi:hypothetical protein
MTARYRCGMSEPSDDSTAQLEEQLDGVSRTRLGMAPATDEEFASLVDEMGSPDGEG